MHIILIVEISTMSAPCVAQDMTAREFYQDSLHRHIWVEGCAELDCRFNYAQGSSTIYTDFENNSRELSQLEEFLRSALAHPNLHIERIRLTGYSSVEGNYHQNELLARQRVEGFYQYLRVHYPELHRYPHDIAWVTEDWDGLSKLVKASVLYEREEVLEIIRKVRSYDTRKELLVRLNGGRAYREMERIMFPKLRRVEIRIEYGVAPVAQEWKPTITNEPVVNDKPAIVDEPIIEDEPISLEHIANGRDAESPSPRTAETRFALKTNLLAWAGVMPDFVQTAPVANVALEYYINRSFSIELGAAYSYWNYNNNAAFQGISGYRVESHYRFPFVSERLWGYLGPYFRIGDYDTQNSELTTQNSTGDYRDVGLSAGLTFSIVGSLGLEIGARAGYVKTKAALYTREAGENWFDEYKPYNKMKVTDLNISLIYRFR